MNGAPDFEAMLERLREYVLSLRNTDLDPDEPLINDVYEIIDDGRENDNAPHQSPRLGIQHDGATFPVNDVLGGGVSQPGLSLWRLILLVDSPQRMVGMAGPRGARRITKQLVDYLSTWTIDEENGECPLSCTSMIRYVPPDESLRPECGYYLEFSHPVTID